MGATKGVKRKPTPQAVPGYRHLLAQHEPEDFWVPRDALRRHYSSLALVSAAGSESRVVLALGLQSTKSALATFAADARRMVDKGQHRAAEPHEHSMSAAAAGGAVYVPVKIGDWHHIMYVELHEKDSLREAARELAQGSGSVVLDALGLLLEHRSAPVALDAGPGDGPELYVGRSACMKKLDDQLWRFAASDVPVLIVGETGTGKELVAQAIHERSHRSRRRLVSVNCAAIPESLAESTLFGHVKGAFTGATEDRLGIFREAQGGTLFLDEVGEMPDWLQSKLLRVLQEKTLRPVGAAEDVAVDVRIVSATNRDPERALREDLFQRLEGVMVVIPPLRDRREDILPLAKLLLKQLAFDHDRARVVFSPPAQKAISSCPWPRNVRQLRYTIERALLLCDGRAIKPEHLQLPGGQASVVKPEPIEHRRLVAFLRAFLTGVDHAIQGLGLDSELVWEMAVDNALREVARKVDGVERGKLGRPPAWLRMIRDGALGQIDERLLGRDREATRGELKFFGDRIIEDARKLGPLSLDALGQAASTLLLLGQERSVEPIVAQVREQLLRSGEPLSPAPALPEGSGTMVPEAREDGTTP